MHYTAPTISKLAHTRRITTTLNHIVSPSQHTIMSSTLHTNGTSNGKSSDADRPILMIPGPTEYHPDVLHKLSEPSLSHTSPAFINEFSELIRGIRTVFSAGSNVQPFILSGSGTIGWDITAANVCEPGDNALILNTGYFSDSYAVCCETYQINIDQIKAKSIGDTITVEQIQQHFRDNPNKRYKLICITHVDTSTAVLNNVQQLISTVRKYQPDAYYSVDGVCSFGGERLLFDEWNVDITIGCSQKALGAPPGLSILLVSARAIQSIQSRQTNVLNYFGNLKNWLPIMSAYENHSPAYFATPNVNLIRAQNHAIKLLNQLDIHNVYNIHEQTAKRFRAAMRSMNLKFVPTNDSYTANTLLAIYYPTNTTFRSTEFLAAVSKCNVILAGGLHKDIKTKYFRVGTMGYSVWGNTNHIERTITAIESALIQCGAEGIEPGKALAVFQSTQ